MKFDSSHYSLRVEGFEDAFAVFSFTLRESVCGLDKLVVIASCEENGLEYDELIGKGALFTFEFFGDEQYFHGKVLSFEEEPLERGQSRCRLVIEPTLNLLNYGEDCKVYRKQDVTAILRQTLAKGQISGQMLDMQAAEGSREIDFCVQYNESDFTFLRRLESRFGIFHFLRHEPKSAVLVMAEDNKAFVSGTLDDFQYVPGSGMGSQNPGALSQLRRSQALQTGKTTIRSYNYEAPHAFLAGESGNAELALHARYQIGPSDDSAATRTASIQMETARAAREYISGVSHTPGLRVGHCFTLASGDHPTGFEGEYVVVSVEHTGSQEAALTGSGQDTPYRNAFEAQPKKIAYRPSQVPPAPRIHGVIVARIEGEEGDYAKVDQQGRYTVKLPFDQENHGGESSSCPVRMAQPHAGPGFGHHFPLHKDADAVLAFENGDIDKPIVLGAAPNPNNTSPVTQDNRSENVISTLSGHKLVLDDKKDHTKVQLVTAGGLRLVLDDTPESQGITLGTPKSHEMKFSEKDNTLNLGIDGGAYNLCMEKAQQRIKLTSASGSALVLDDQNKKVELLTSGGMTLQLDDSANIIVLKDSGGANILTIDSAGNKVMVNSGGDIMLEATANLSIKAGANLTLGAGGNLVIEGAQVALSGSQGVKLESSMALNASAGTDLKFAAGVNGEITAGAMQKVSSPMTTLEGQTMTTIQGAMVKIN